ncbi:MAG TPA: hypothetical protein VIR29_09225 [Anseongella sp.]
MSTDRYLPVPWDFREMLDEAIREGRRGRIHYFSHVSDAGASGEVKADPSGAGESAASTAGNRTAAGISATSASVGIGQSEGCIRELKREASGEYLFTDSRDKIRLDTIITLFGKPGPAFNDYESYGNACMACRDDDE